MQEDTHVGGPFGGRRGRERHGACVTLPTTLGQATRKTPQPRLEPPAPRDAAPSSSPAPSRAPANANKDTLSARHYQPLAAHTCKMNDIGGGSHQRLHIALIIEGQAVHLRPFQAHLREHIFGVVGTRVKFCVIIVEVDNLACEPRQRAQIRAAIWHALSSYPSSPRLRRLASGRPSGSLERVWLSPCPACDRCACFCV